MGGGISTLTTSLSSMTPEHIADSIASLGPAYEQYKQEILESGVSGALILSLTENDLENFLDELSIEKKMHRRVLINKFKELCSLKTSPSRELLLTTQSSSPAKPSMMTKGSQNVCNFLPEGFKYVFFATHTWLPDNLSRNTHDRVIQIYRLLVKRGNFKLNKQTDIILPDIVLIYFKCYEYMYEFS